jgi:CRP-like cAMP-binding protein
MSEDFIERFIALAEKRRTCDPGSLLFHQGDRVRAVFVVEEGLVELTRQQEDGTAITLQRATGHTVLAEASVYSEAYHCAGLVGAPTRLFELPKTSFLAYIQKDAGFSSLWAKHLAREVQSARHRSEVLSRKTVGARLDGWLAWHGSTVPAKGQWKTVAQQIGVSPEALYRELAKRRQIL